MPISQVVAARADNGNLYNNVPVNQSADAGGNGGSVAKASSTSLLDGVSVSRYNDVVFGSVVVDNDDANKALSTGTFAYDNESPIAKRVTTSLCGVNNSVLESGAAQPSLIQSIHKIQSVTTRKLTKAIRQNKFNEYNGEFDSGYPQVSVDTFLTDNAANPSRAVPGELTYKSGSPNPVNDDYKEKTG